MCMVIHSCMRVCHHGSWTFLSCLSVWFAAQGQSQDVNLQRDFILVFWCFFHFFPFSYVFDASTRTNISIRVGLEELLLPYVSDCHETL